MNIICILAGGVGNRFGDPMPKQYHLANGRPIIEYTIAAALTCGKADEVIAVAGSEHVSLLADKYSLTAIEGGANRNLSLHNAIKFISANYDCENIMVIDAVCPLVTPALMDSYFEQMSEYDIVVTAAKIPCSLGCYHMHEVDREDYYMIESPDVFKFRMLRDNFDPASRLSTPVHQMPESAKIKLNFGFRNYAKVIYPHDIAVIEALLNERDKRLKFESHKNDATLAMYKRMKYRKPAETREWEKRLDRDVAELFSKWGVYAYSVNPGAYSGLVIEAETHSFGSAVIKMYPPFMRDDRYLREIRGYEVLPKSVMCEILDTDDKLNAMLLRRVKPGDYMDFITDRALVRAMFEELYKNRVRISDAGDISYFPELSTLLLETLNEALNYDFYPEKLKALASRAHGLLEGRFKNAERYVVHGDAYFKNALKAKDNIVLIDPLCYNAPYAIEYMPFCGYELLCHASDVREKWLELKAFFAEFTDISEFDDALMLWLVVCGLMPSVYEANDGFERASGWLNVIESL